MTPAELRVDGPWISSLRDERVEYLWAAWRLTTGTPHLPTVRPHCAVNPCWDKRENGQQQQQDKKSTEKETSGQAPSVAEVGRHRWHGWHRVG